ncbi:hypothetical protein LNKW23_02140 [Paralimibaculum aggregatum]|uniref:Mur ligase central domain-containing protein n=1 Tax=Paralimibaculum aggregatum TaxID=3036245 RepID=A0ABQ6LCA1_9RHOB|nr:Mur ligase family protein [Limibaculum sp. NKW23]GMG81002.1 hypothetical protein LNKW23_02140 [Limibaculum sp. NKW23]
MALGPRFLRLAAPLIGPGGVDAAITLKRDAEGLAALLPARAWRALHPRLRVVGITGSCGKTTATGLIGAVLAEAGPVICSTRPWAASGAAARLSQGANARRPIGRLMLRARGDTRFFVAEMGGGDAGGLRQFARHLRPDIAVVTHVRLDHRSRYRNHEAVAADKGRLIAALPPEGLAILNADDPHVAAMRRLTRARVIACGRAEGADLRLLDASASLTEGLRLALSHDSRRITLATRFTSEIAVMPLMAAVAAGLAVGVAPARIRAVLEAAEPPPGRMRLHRLDSGIAVIDDSVKAPLYSVEQALDALAAAEAARKVAVIGTLSDLGSATSTKYRRVARQALAVADTVLFVGPWAGSVARLKAEAGAGRLLTAETAAEALAQLGPVLGPGALVLLKGSNNADHLERLLLALSGQEVACDRIGCGRHHRCEDCALLAP